MKEIEIKMKLKVDVDANLTLHSIHHSVKEWMNQSNINYQLKGEDFQAPIRLIEIETSSENLSYITLTRYDKFPNEENHIKTKIHVP